MIGVLDRSPSSLARRVVWVVRSPGPPQLGRTWPLEKPSPSLAFLRCWSWVSLLTSRSRGPSGAPNLARSRGSGVVLMRCGYMAGLRTGLRGLPAARAGALYFKAGADESEWPVGLQHISAWLQ